jgi:hypothetical protein
VLGGVVGLAVGGWLLLHTSMFQARTIRIEGASPEPAAMVRAASGITSSTPLVSIDPALAATGVTALPWVATATVTLHWPSTVVIAVTSRHAVAVMHAPGRHALVDGTGRVLARPRVLPAGAPSVHLMVPGVIPGVPGTWLSARAAPAVKVAGTLPAAFAGQVRTVVGNPDGTVSLEMTTPVTFELGTATHLHAKYVDIAAIIAGTTLNAGDVIDVSVPQSSTITGP